MNSNSNLILTPTPRLARALARRLAEAHIARGETAWPRAEVMSWPGWMNRLLDDWLLETGDTRVPLAGPQANAIWSELIDRDVFLAAGRVARMAERSWRELHEWGLPEPERWPRLVLNEDSRQFRRWAGAWRKRVNRENRLDPVSWQAELPDRIADGEIPLPESITLHGFELPPTPLMTGIVTALEAAGVSVKIHLWEALPGPTGCPDSAPPFVGARSPLPQEIADAFTSRGGGKSVMTVSVNRKLPTSQAKGGVLKAAADGEDELRQAAAWARDRAEHHGKRVAIVVPDLEGRLADVDRILRETLQPDGFRLAPEKLPPWHVSLGQPLTQWPLTADALRVLNSNPDQLDILEFGALLRSPYLAGWNAERDARAMLDAAIRGLPGDRVTLFRVQKEIGDGLPELSGRLDAWKECREQATDTTAPSAWSQQFSNELEAIGLGAGRPLDSVEFQLLDAWKDVLEKFAALEAVMTSALTRRSALDRLSELARGRVFREQNPGVPIEVMGVLEALGGEFDGIWVTGMDEASWPPPARPDPLLPHELQKVRPESTADGMLEQSRRILDGLVRTAPEVVFSWPKVSGDETLGPSRLLYDLESVGGPFQGRLAGAPSVGPGKGLPQETELRPWKESCEDFQAPAHPGGKVRGGAGLLANQSACPFKAFAAHRLEAGDLEHPRAGLDARYRGILLHEALEYFWREAGSSEILARILDDSESDGRGQEAPPTIQASAEHAISRLLDHNLLALSPPMRTLETRRLVERLREWLALESARPPFRVTQAEQWLKLNIGGLSLSGKLDRVDQLEDGRTVLIDYKSGAVSTRNWYPEERLRDPQLPLYYLHVDPPPAAIAFACLRPDQLGWQGLAEDDLEIEGIKPLEKAGRTWSEVEDWDTLVEGWRERVTELAGEFRSGLAAVEPRDKNVCTYCHLGALCRIRERAE